MTKKDTKFSKDKQPATRGGGEVIAKSNKERQIISDAYRLALHREVLDADGKKSKVITEMAKKMADMALEGDLGAMKEIADRTEGKAMQAIEMSGKDGGPIETVDYSGLSDAAIAELMAAINAKTDP